MTDLTENVANNVANEKVQDYVKKSHITTENEQKSEKTAQDVQKNCLSLTEKWKKGELINEEDAGCYYIETIDGEIYSDCLSPIDGFQNTYNYAVNKILAPVPSYEEWYKFNQLLGKCYRFLRLTETKVEAIEKVKRGLVKEIDEVLK